MADQEEGPQLNRVYFATKFGIPEIDRIIEAQKFLRPKTNPYSQLIAVPEDKNSTKEDRISQLPNDIPRFIISFLPMKQGAITSILAKRWRNLWRASVSCLNLRHMYPDNFFRGKTNAFFKKERGVFISRVYRLLHFRCALRLDALRISFPFCKDSASNTDTWLSSAAAQGVTQLTLDFTFLNLGLGYRPIKAYKFPTHMFAQQLEYLSLKCCIFQFPPNFEGFKSLVSLILQHVRLTESDVRNILSNSCSSLERLSLTFCFFLDCDLGLNFSGPSLVLKHISCNQCQGINEIKVHDINILSFELDFSDRRSKLSIQNAPHLARLVLGTYHPTNIMCDVPCLEKLFLSSWPGECIRPKLCDLNNLKQLVVLADRNNKANLLEVVYLLEACPLLQKLELDMGTSTESVEHLENIRTRPTLPNNNLKQVEIYGFEGLPTKIECARYLLKNAVFLEKMNISTERKVYCSNGVWFSHESTRKQQGISLKEVRDLLQKEVCSSTELIIGSHNSIHDNDRLFFEAR